MTIGDTSSFVPNEVLGFNTSEEALQAAIDLGFAIQSTEVFPGLALTLTRFSLPPGLDTIAAVQLLRQRIEERSFTLNHIYRLEGKPCRSFRCYGARLVRWTGNSACSAGARIGILDTGVDLDHPALKGRDLNVKSFREAGATPSPMEHGTAVAALLAGDPQSRTPGLVYRAEVFAADVFYSDAEGRAASNAIQMLRGIDWLKANGVSVINMSLAGPANPALEQAIATLKAEGIIATAAAGNGGPNAPPRYPAAYADVIAVTAVDGRLRPYWRANRGDYIDYAAPGVRVWTAAPGNKSAYVTGTSYAAPFVTAIIATIRAGQPDIADADGLDRYLKVRDLGRKGKDSIYGRGLILAPRACKPS